MGYRGGLGRRLLSLLGLGALVAMVIALVIVFSVGRPPRTFRIAAGAEGGAYAAFAEALRADLAHDLRRTIRFVVGRVEARSATLRDLEAAGATPLPDFGEAPPETPAVAETSRD